MTSTQSHEASKQIVQDSHLPFQKKHGLFWSILESQEVFKKLPQKPHFRPLELLSEICREGEAIACMVNFSSVVERCSKAQFLNEPKSLTNELLEIVSKLEDNGFNVDIVRQRIAMKEKMDKLQEQLEEVKAQFQTSVASLGITGGVNLGVGSTGDDMIIQNDLEAEQKPVGQLSVASGEDAQMRKRERPRKFYDYVLLSDSLKSQTYIPLV